MNQAYSQATAYISSQFARVEVPLPGVPNAPDADDVVDKTKSGTEWVAGLSPAFWTIVVVLVCAAIAVTALRNPLVKGAVLMLILVGIVGAIISK